MVDTCDADTQVADPAGLEVRDAGLRCDTQLVNSGKAATVPATLASPLQGVPESVPRHDLQRLRVALASAAPALSHAMDCDGEAGSSDDDADNLAAAVAMEALREEGDASFEAATGDARRIGIARALESGLTLTLAGVYPAAARVIVCQPAGCARALASTVGHLATAISGITPGPNAVSHSLEAIQRQPWSDAYVPLIWAAAADEPTNATLDWICAACAGVPAQHSPFVDACAPTTAVRSGFLSLREFFRAEGISDQLGLCHWIQQQGLPYVRPRTYL